MALSGLTGASLQMWLVGDFDAVWDELERFQTLVASLVVVGLGGAVAEGLRAKSETRAEEIRERREIKGVASILFGEWDANMSLYQTWLGPAFDEKGDIDITNLPPDPLPNTIHFTQTGKQNRKILGPEFNASADLFIRAFIEHRKAVNNSGAKGFGNSNPAYVWQYFKLIVEGLRTCSETGELEGIVWPKSTVHTG